MISCFYLGLQFKFSFYQMWVCQILVGNASFCIEYYKSIWWFLRRNHSFKKQSILHCLYSHVLSVFAFHTLEDWAKPMLYVAFSGSHRHLSLWLLVAHTSFLLAHRTEEPSIIAGHWRMENDDVYINVFYVRKLLFFVYQQHKTL